MVVLSIDVFLIVMILCPILRMIGGVFLARVGSTCGMATGAVIFRGIGGCDASFRNSGFFVCLSGLIFGLWILLSGSIR